MAQPDTPAAAAPDDGVDAEGSPPGERFSVDTGLFRELGELLVGRDSTALIELIKNAYDADAANVTVLAQHLADPRKGQIVISDDGNGMTEPQFRRGFLRVASRLKGDVRKSPVYGRRFTGAKGIGRLAAHKLAAEIHVDTRALAGRAKHTERRTVAEHVVASIDWDEVERHEVLEDVGNAIQLAAGPPSKGAIPGTTIRLQRLRRPWTEGERTSFVREVSTFQAGEAFVRAIAPEHIASKLLFDVPDVRDVTTSGGEFSVNLGGEFAVGDDYSMDVLSAAAWVLEIQAVGKTIKYAVAPTTGYAAREKIATQPVTATQKRKVGPEFQARILVRSGQSPAKLGDLYGVRVYMEGFRVLPYGEPGDDWLNINARYVQRDRGLAQFIGTVADPTVARLDDENAGLVAPSQRQVFGAVFLREAKAPTLQMLVNREGFVPNEDFLAVRDAVSNGVALQTRVSAALRPNRKNDIKESADQPMRLMKAEPAFEVALARVREVAADKRLEPLQREEIAEAVSRLELVRDDFLDEQTMLRVLASLGTQTAAFVHEINAALGSLAHLQRRVEQMLEEPPTSREIARLQRSLDALRRTLERQSAYLVRIVSPDARRRRSRQRLADHFNHAALLLEPAAQREGIALSNSIPDDLKSPPMFPAELTSVFTNLLSNAIKAAGPGGKIRATGRSADRRVLVDVENTGVKVDLDDAEKWFAPYQSTTALVDPSLGQGMGLGLTITRAMLAEYRGDIAFVEPSRGYVSAVRFTLPA